MYFFLMEKSVKLTPENQSEPAKYLSQYKGFQQIVTHKI